MEEKEENLYADKEFPYEMFSKIENPWKRKREVRKRLSLIERKDVKEEAEVFLQSIEREIIHIIKSRDKSWNIIPIQRLTNLIHMYKTKIFKLTAQDINDLSDMERQKDLYDISGAEKDPDEYISVLKRLDRYTERILAL